LATGPSVKGQAPLPNNSIDDMSYLNPREQQQCMAELTRLLNEPIEADAQLSVMEALLRATVAMTKIVQDHCAMASGDPVSALIASQPKCGNATCNAAHQMLRKIASHQKGLRKTVNANHDVAAKHLRAWAGGRRDSGVRKRTRAPSIDRLEAEAEAMKALSQEKSKLTEENSKLKMELKQSTTVLQTLEKELGIDLKARGAKDASQKKGLASSWFGFGGQRDGEEADAQQKKKQQGKDKLAGALGSGLAGFNNSKTNTAALEKQVEMWKQKATEHQKTAEVLKEENTTLRRKVDEADIARKNPTGSKWSGKSLTVEKSGTPNTKITPNMGSPRMPPTGKNAFEPWSSKKGSATAPGRKRGPASWVSWLTGGSKAKTATHNRLGDDKKKTGPGFLQGMQQMVAGTMAQASQAYGSLEQQIPCTRPHANRETYSSYLSGELMAWRDVLVFCWLWIHFVFALVKGTVFRSRATSLPSLEQELEGKRGMNPARTGLSDKKGTIGAKKTVWTIPRMPTLPAPDVVLRVTRHVLILASLHAYYECLVQQYIWHRANNYTRSYLAGQMRGGTRDHSSLLAMVGLDPTLWWVRLRFLGLGLVLTWDWVVELAIHTDWLTSLVCRCGLWAWNGMGWLVSRDWFYHGIWWAVKGAAVRIWRFARRAWAKTAKLRRRLGWTRCCVVVGVLVVCGVAGWFLAPRAIGLTASLVKASSGRSKPTSAAIGANVRSKLVAFRSSLLGAGRGGL